MHTINHSPSRKGATPEQLEEAQKIRTNILVKYSPTAYMQLTGKPDPYFNTVGETISDLWREIFFYCCFQSVTISNLTYKQAECHIQMLRISEAQLKQAFDDISNS